MKNIRIQNFTFEDLEQNGIHCELKIYLSIPNTCILYLIVQLDRNTINSVQEEKLGILLHSRAVRNVCRSA